MTPLFWIVGGVVVLVLLAAWRLVARARQRDDAYRRAWESAFEGAALRTTDEE